MRKLTIAVIFGGCSPEYPVSLESSYSVITSIDAEKYDVITVGITQGGEWYRYLGSPEGIESDTWLDDYSLLVPAAISPDREKHGLIEFHQDGMSLTRLDAVFPVLHGRNGEDGTVQGLCELAGIPIVGCGTLASALCMDKDRAHRLAAMSGVKVPAAAVVSTSEQAALLKAAEGLRYPLFVKPVRAGSSFGITQIKSASELHEAVSYALRYDREAIIEETVPGFEVGCAVMGNDELTIGRADEIEIQGDFFDYVEKYNQITSKIHTPGRIDAETEARVRETAAVIYKALGCRGFARVDMFLTPEGEIVMNEVNTIPGFTSHSRYPRMMACIGIEFPELVDRLIALALEP